MHSRKCDSGLDTKQFFIVSLRIPAFFVEHFGLSKSVYLLVQPRETVPSGELYERISGSVNTSKKERGVERD